MIRGLCCVDRAFPLAIMTPLRASGERAVVMRIELENLEGKKGDFAHVYQPDDLNPIDERVNLTEPAAVYGKVKRSGNEVFVNGHIDTRARVECDRCLQPVELPVTADFELEYISGADYESTEVAELTEAEMSVSVFDGQGIDVDEIVKEQILLAVPTRMLCREDCKGICPECGIDRNTSECKCVTKDIDPRWAALKNLTE
jgi:uncharacterized protein